MWKILCGKRKTENPADFKGRKMSEMCHFRRFCSGRLHLQNETNERHVNIVALIVLIVMRTFGFDPPVR